MKKLLVLFIFLGACTPIYYASDDDYSECCCAKIESGLNVWSCANWPYLRDACYPTDRRAVCKNNHHHDNHKEKHSHWHKH